MFIKNISGETQVSVDLGVRKIDIASGDVVYITEDLGRDLADGYPTLFERIDVSNATIQKEVTIATADVLTLNGTAVELIAAPGAGYYIAVDKVTTSVDYNSAAYATNTTLELRYGTATTKISADIAALLVATADNVQSVGGLEAELAIALNDNVEINVATGNPTAGNSDVKIVITYRIQAI